MSENAFRVLALGHVRSTWMTQLTQWSTAGIIPAEITKCVSLHEAVARIDAPSRWSALLVDATISGLDRELIGNSNDHNIPVFVIDDVIERYERWVELGATSCLRSSLSPSSFTDMIRAHSGAKEEDTAASPISKKNNISSNIGTVFAVCGAGGTGVSSTAAALAQGLVDNGDAVLLADFAQNAQQGMLHDASDVIPSIDELVEICRSRNVSREEIQKTVFHVPERGYDLLLGMHRPLSWTTLTPRACAGALRAMQESYAYVVADITADFLGEQETGSRGIEDRNLLNRAAASHADLVFLVATPCMKGLHSLFSVADSLVDFGVAPGRIVPVVTKASKRGKGRAEIAKTVRVLTRERKLCPLVFLPDKPMERIFQDGVRLPEAITSPISQAAKELVSFVTRDHESTDSATPEAIIPGSLGIAQSA